jgi:hypothetical protein
VLLTEQNGALTFLDYPFLLNHAREESQTDVSDFMAETPIAGTFTSAETLRQD